MRSRDSLMLFLALLFTGVIGFMFGTGNMSVTILGWTFPPSGGSAGPLTLALASTTIPENGGTTTATVRRAGTTATPMTVNLACSDSTEASLPSSVVIPAGAAVSPPFTITGVDDSMSDGMQMVTISASCPEGVANDTLRVTDDEGGSSSASGTLTLSLSTSSISETSGTVTMRVQRSGSTSSPVTVSLMASDTDELNMPNSVPILAGQAQSSAISITGVDDTVTDGTQMVTITASAAGYTPGTRTLRVVDDGSGGTADYTVMVTTGVGYFLGQGHASNPIDGPETTAPVYFEVHGSNGRMASSARISGRIFSAGLTERVRFSGPDVGDLEHVRVRRELHPTDQLPNWQIANISVTKAPHSGAPSATKRTLISEIWLLDSAWRQADLN